MFGLHWMKVTISVCAYVVCMVCVVSVCPLFRSDVVDEDQGAPELLDI